MHEEWEIIKLCKIFLMQVCDDQVCLQLDVVDYLVLFLIFNSFFFFS